MIRKYGVAPDRRARAVLLVLAVAHELLHPEPAQQAFFLPHIQSIRELGAIGLALKGVRPDAFRVPEGNVRSQEKRVRTAVNHALVHVHMQEARRARTSSGAIEPTIVPAPGLTKV